jgi:hypothetical protein
MATTERPEFVTDAMLTYLDELRESGETNMFGAGGYLDAEFPELWMGGEAPRSYRSSDKARKVLSYWMATFSDRRKAAESAHVS